MSGNPLPSASASSGERRLAAVLFTDVVGYSARMQRDETGTMAQVKADFAAMREQCAQHGGEVLNTMGDGLLMCFASAVQAVTCALQIQAEFNRRGAALSPGQALEHRMGVHIGDVFRQEEGGVAGDGVNIAARLEGKAPAGGVCISQMVYDTVRGKVAMQAVFVGPESFKNIAAPIPIWLLAPESGPAPTRPPVKVAPGERRWRPVAIAAAVLVLVALLAAGGLYYRSHPGRPLTDTDTIVLADFTNTTGDPVFDGTLRQGLAAQLAQSPFLRLTSDESVAHTLALMSQPNGARLTPELAREVGKRTASAATIEGSIASLGSEYVLGLKAVACSNGDLLFQQQVTAGRKEQVLEALGKAATDLRAKLGESLASVQKYSALPQNVTTPSLEALQAYSLGMKNIQVTNDFAAAIPFFQQAIRLDPKFAMAFLESGWCYFPLGELSASAESIRQAYDLRERTTDQEKLCISSNYELVVTGNLEAARTVTSLWTQTYPRDDDPQTNLWLIYLYQGDYAAAGAAAQQAGKLNPENSNDLANIIFCQQWLNRLQAAKTTAQEAHAKNVSSPWLPLILYEIAFLEHDDAEMERQATSPVVKPVEDMMFFLQSETAANGGEFARSRELNRRAIDTAARAGEKEGPAEYQAHAAVREALAGQADVAKQEAQGALARAKGKHVEAFAGIALGLAGEAEQAARLADDLGQRYPQDTVVRFDYVPMIRAAIALRSGDAARALEALEASAPYELGHTNATFTFALYPVYLRGEALLVAKRGDAAAKEFQKIIDQSGVVGNEPIGALAQLGLGRAHALSGNAAKARSAYQEFLHLWKNADADLPLLKQAKAEFSRLQ